MKTDSGFIFSSPAETDREQVIDLFNYSIKNSFAAYPEQPVPYGFFDLFLEATQNYPSVVACEADGEGFTGFGMLRAHNPMPVFAHTAEITYFLQPEYTGKGLGTLILQKLETEGKARGIMTILAGISSKNEGSIRFHKKTAFWSAGVSAMRDEKTASCSIRSGCRNLSESGRPPHYAGQKSGGDYPKSRFPAQTPGFRPPCLHVRQGSV
ncbi:MAG: N-acetyltransferase family protein [Methanoregula sp.]|jgi:phosphinothricin acetyltransferase